MALDTLAGVRAEMSRLYRLALNGRIRSDETTRFIYALKEIRACLEAEILTDVQHRLAKRGRPAVAVTAWPCANLGISGTLGILKALDVLR
jgi:hypothetical protein